MERDWPRNKTGQPHIHVGRSRTVNAWTKRTKERKISK